MARLGDGTGSLHLTHGVDAVQLEQLRADLALDLIIGRALIQADQRSWSGTRP